MICSRGHVIRDGHIACETCARLASILREREIARELWRGEFRKIHAGWRSLWVQDMKDGMLHFSFACWIDFVSVAFCGKRFHAASAECVGGYLVEGGPNADNLVYPFDDPRACPLCVDRIKNEGGGICAEVCLTCGGRDGAHEKGCDLYLPDDAVPKERSAA